MFESIDKLGKFFYNTIGPVDPNEELFNIVFSSGKDCYHGMAWCFIFMVGAALLSSAFYYFFVDSDAKKATPKNYLMVFVMGYILLVAVNYLGITSISGEDAYTTLNLLYITLVDIIYYTIVFELFSLFFKGFSKYSTSIDLISVLFNKNI